MTNEIKKCPNCGHQFKTGEEYCPNCDLFIPMNEQNENDATFDPEKTQTFKAFKQTENTPEENFSEPTFKHRGKTAEDDPTDITEETEAVKKPLEETKEAVTEQTQPFSTEESVEKETIDLPVNEEEPTNTHFEEQLEEKETLEEIQEQPLINEVDLVNVSEDKQVEVRHDKEQPASNKKKTKTIIGMSAAVVLIVGGLTFYSTQQKKNEEKATTELVSTTELNLSSLYNSSEHIFLKKNVTQDDIKKAKESLEKLKGNKDYADFKKEFDTVEEKFNKQNALNTVFKKPIINSDQLDTKVYVKNADKLSMNKIATEKDGFDILYNKAFAEAEEQKSLLTKANDSLSVVYKEDQVVKDASIEQYEDAEKAIKSVKDPEAKKDFSENLDKVKSFLDEKEKQKQAEAEAFAAEQAKIVQQEQQIETKPNNNSNNYNNNGTFKETDPNSKWGNRKDGSINNDDSAWAWNPGIQDKVVSEVISRGYVAEGGYYLEPVYIENGEGFYNLYATTNSKIFPKSKAEEFPLYVVTINAKTGWFKGNGPN